jgi:hypothetical protein
MDPGHEMRGRRPRASLSFSVRCRCCLTLFGHDPRTWSILDAGLQCYPPNLPPLDACLTEVFDAGVAGNKPSSGAVPAILSDPSSLITPADVEGRCRVQKPRRSLGLRVRAILVRLPELRQVPAEVHFEVARNTVTDITDPGTVRLRTGPRRRALHGRMRSDAR